MNLQEADSGPQRAPAGHQTEWGFALIIELGVHIVITHFTDEDMEAQKSLQSGLPPAPHPQPQKRWGIQGNRVEVPKLNGGKILETGREEAAPGTPGSCLRTYSVQLGLP